VEIADFVAGVNSVLGVHRHITTGPSLQRTLRFLVLNVCILLRVRSVYLIVERRSVMKHNGVQRLRQATQWSRVRRRPSSKTGLPYTNYGGL
jgi:hypothetical protein